MYTMLYMYCGMLYLNNNSIQFMSCIVECSAWIIHIVLDFIHVLCGLLLAEHSTILEHNLCHVLWITQAWAIYNTWIQLCTIVIQVEQCSMHEWQCVHNVIHVLCNCHNAWITMCTHCHSCIVDCSILEYTIVYTMLFMYCSNCSMLE